MFLKLRNPRKPEDEEDAVGCVGDLDLLFGGSSTSIGFT